MDRSRARRLATGSSRSRFCGTPTPRSRLGETPSAPQTVPCSIPCPRTTPAPPVALGTSRRSPARRLPWAARWRHAALWPPTAAALCRVACAGGLVPFHAFERSLVIFSPSCPSLQWFIPHSRTAVSPLYGVVLGRVCAVPRPVCAAHLLLVTVVVSSAETHRSGRALVHGALRDALSRRGPLRGRTPAPRRRIRAEVPASVGARVRRGRRARGTRWRRRVPRARFVHRQQSALERLIVEAAYSVLGVGPGAEFHEGDPARLAGVAVRGQREVRERTNGGEVRTQLRLRHVIREVANKQAHSHSGLLLGEWGMDVPHPRRVAVSRPVRSGHADSRLREHGVPGARS